MARAQDELPDEAALEAALDVLTGKTDLQPPAAVTSGIGHTPASLFRRPAWSGPLPASLAAAALPATSPAPSPRKLLSHTGAGDEGSVQCGGLYPPVGCVGDDCTNARCPLLPADATTLEDCFCAVSCVGTVLLSWCAAGFGACSATCNPWQRPNPATGCPNSCTVQVGDFFSYCYCTRDEWNTCGTTVQLAAQQAFNRIPSSYLSLSVSPSISFSPSSAIPSVASPAATTLAPASFASAPASAVPSSVPASLAPSSPGPAALTLALDPTPVFALAFSCASA
ncbi:hypothetical protein HYH03_007949 [Edaphochlamys debaryana]|uniref:Uncharacterized protein n=1 Tax=Edaphochlamys debaryana TaxID=47281 RepID=A0A835Y2G8_9CHLO|nr:hypothetical protein HYH03_007949 [Edaphochlamys debaryana]|eukprot:KAG2494024.1 hypothetical protein HYH03_007949 [Edaphochlamys debaryana]